MRRRQLYAVEAGGCAPPVVIEGVSSKDFLGYDATPIPMPKRVCPKCGKTGRGISLHIQHCKHKVSKK